MGIFLSLIISPSRIPEKQWESVYEEALRIVDHCNLLDVVSLKRNGIRYRATRKTAERIFSEDGPCIRICGTMASGFDMEDFYLFRQKPCCSNRDVPDNGVDILFYNCDDLGLPVPTSTHDFWVSKTQGKPGHIPLLAIACLFTDRFPEAVNVLGDITAGQCRAAVRLANQCLERPIQVPVTCRAEALIQRLRKSCIPVRKQLQAFFRLYLGKLTPEVGKALKEPFPEEELYRHFRELLTPGKENENPIGFEQALRNYLLLGLSPVGLLKMLAQDTAGPRLPLEETLSKLFACQVHIPLEETLSKLFACQVHIPLDQKNCMDPLGMEAAVEGDNEKPYTVIELMNRMLIGMCAGRNRTLPVYLPLETIRNACHQVFPNTDTDALVDGLLANLPEDERQKKIYGTDDTALMNQFQKKAEDGWKKVRGYDLRAPKELRRWRPGLTIEPDLEIEFLAMMRKARTFSSEQEWQGFLALNRVERENWFIGRDPSIQDYGSIMPETVWDHIFGHVMDDAYILRYFVLFHVRASSQLACEALASVLANPSLADKLWEDSAEGAVQAAD